MLALDPGIRVAGAALLDEHNRRVLAAAIIKNPCRSGHDLEAQHDMAHAALKWAVSRGLNLAKFPALVAEWPQIYAFGKGKGDPNVSLLPLCGVVAHVSSWANWGERTIYRPREWKGTVQGDVMTDRILERLDPEELKALEACAPSLKHNMVDAVGIGLKKLGRLERRRNYG